MKQAASEATAFVRRFIANRARQDPRDLGDEIDLFAAGLLDSLGLLELVSAVEQRFGIALDFADLDLEQFSRIGDFAALVERSAGDGPSPSAVIGGDEGQRLLCASEIAHADMLHARLVRLALDAAQPYASALYGDDATATAIFAATMGHRSSEISLDRTQILMEGADLRGCYIALPGGELQACRRTELLEALRHFGPGRTALLRSRLASLGTLLSPVADDEFYLSKIAVCPEARGRGLGRVLLQHYLRRGRHMGFRRFRLDVCSDNLGARRLYERAGFHVVDQRRSDPHDLTYLSMAAPP